LCHSERGSAKPTFVLAGTVFWGPQNYDRRVDHAYVRVVGPDKTQRCFVTNCNGNFFVREQDYPNLKFPLLVSVERVRNPAGNTPDDQKTLQKRPMAGHIGREPSCAGCHVLNIRDFGSPGQIRMFDTEAEVDAAAIASPSSCPNDEPRVTQCPEDRL